VQLALVETNAEDLEFATTDLVDISTLSPLDLPAIPLTLASSELTVEPMECVLPTEMPLLAPQMLTVPPLESTLTALALPLELTSALKDLDSTQLAFLPSPNS